jgi:nucleotide-binding universal stress UspA family protein
VLRGILVGLDGSPHSGAAVELSLQWAQETGAEVTGIGIIDEPTIRKPTGLTIGGGHYKPLVDEQRLADAQQRVESFLDGFVHRCQAASVKCRRLEGVGVPSRQILREAQRHDLIVLGTQSYFQFETHEGPDATLHEILVSTPRPVVTVPTSLPTGRAVVVAYDASVQAARALQESLHAGLLDSRPVHVVSMNTDEQVARSQIQLAADFLRLHGIRSTNHCLTSKRQASTVLLECAEQLNAGLLVLGAYGRQSVMEFFFGSVTRDVLKQTRIPVFLYH